MPTALPTPGRISSAQWTRTRRRRLLAALLLALTSGATIGMIAPGHAAPPPPNTPSNKIRGYWEAPYRWNTPAIHACLLRGNGTTEHSQILWWSAGPDARVWRWNPDESLSPASNILNVPTANSNIFCGGHSVLEDGRLLVTGGTELGDFGIDHVNIFEPLHDPPRWVSPRPRSMIENRYYPTNTTLGDGTVLVSAGQRFQEAVLWGGEQGTARPSESGHFGIRGTAYWLSGATSGTPPTGRVGHTIVFGEDSNVQSLEGWRYLQKSIIFGGEDAAGNLLNDSWGLYLNELGERWWARLHPDPDPVNGYPAPRRGHAALFMVSPDSSMIICGGIDQSGTALSDIWKCYSNGGSQGQGRWVKLSPSGGGAFPGRHGHTMVFDVDLRRAYIFGGQRDAVYENDVWMLNLTGSLALTQLTPTGTPPVGRTAHAAFWDLALSRRRMLVYGGRTDGTMLGDVWELSHLDTQPAWVQRTPIPDPVAGFPPARCDAASFLDRTYDRWTILGGDTTPGAPGGELDDVWQLKQNYPDPNLEPVWVKDPSPLPDGPRASLRAVVDPRYVRSSAPELFFPSVDFWLSMSTARFYMPLYPHMFLLPSGKILYTGPSFYTYLLNIESGQWEQPAWSFSTFRGGTAVQYRPGKILKSGDNGLTSVPTSAVIDLTGEEGAAQWREVSQNSLMVPRVEHNMTILPTGEVLVTGGLKQRIDISTAVRQAQIWNPNTETWTDSLLLAPDPCNRDYHSTALLLPDGRILSGGGDLKMTPQDTTRLTATIYWPPYLFDDNGNVAIKPVIDLAPEEISYGQRFLVDSDDAPRITSVVLMRPGDVTHAFNQEQRYVPLPYSVDAGSNKLVVDAPAHFNLAPVGHYLLFIVDQDSVPSIGRWIKLTQSVSGSKVSTPPSEHVMQISAFPNPFTQRMTVSYFLPQRDNVRIDVFDASGRRVRNMVSELVEPGAREAYWDGRGDFGNPLSDGIYFLRVVTSYGIRSTKVVLAAGGRSRPGATVPGGGTHHH